MSEQLDFRNAYIRLAPNTKGGKKNVLDYGWGSKDAETWQRLPAVDVRAHIASGGNVAILTGKRSGHFTVDVDPKNGGMVTVADLKAAGKTFTRTNRVKTPSGGVHLNYRIPEGVEVRNDQSGLLGPGIDLRGEYGYRVAPPSAVDGKAYTDNGLDYLDPPEWLVELLRERMAAKASRKAAREALEEVEKVTDPPACCTALSEASVKAIVNTMRKLAALPDGKTMTIQGEERGWDSGFWICGVRLVEIARWPYSTIGLNEVRKLFDRFAPNAEGSFDPEHVWERALDTAESWHKGEQHRTTEHVSVLSKADLGIESVPDDEVVSPFQTSTAQEPYLFAEELIDRYFRTPSGVLKLRFRHDDRTFWLWHRGRYRNLTVDEIESRVAKLLNISIETFMSAEGPEVRAVKVKPKVVTEIVRCLSLLTLTSEHGGGALLPSVGGVPFTNGWLDVSTGELAPLGPERDIRWVVQAKYDIEAKCAGWFAFLDSIGWTEGTAERRLLRQWLGYLLSGSKAQEKAALLVGPKRSGKGTILAVAAALLGDGAVGSQLDTFADRFGMQLLIGKGLATVGDARFGFRTDKKVVERLLSLTSNDAMQVDVKNAKPMSINLGARLMIATNEPPHFIEASDALSTRFIVFNFIESFYGREDLSLRARVLAELPGIARWALAGYRELLGLGSFSETASGLAMQEQMIRDAAPIRVFVEEECVLETEAIVESQRLFSEYLLWCEQSNSYKVDRATFFRDLNVAFPGKIANHRKRKGDKFVTCKRGIRLQA